MKQLSCSDTALMEAAIKGEIGVVQRVLLAGNVYVFAQNNEGLEGLLAMDTQRRCVYVWKPVRACP